MQCFKNVQPRNDRIISNQAKNKRGGGREIEILKKQKRSVQHLKQAKDYGLQTA